jgi:hypothetical protein
MRLHYLIEPFPKSSANRCRRANAAVIRNICRICPQRLKGGTANMDVFKLAFETTIVGLLAFLWLGAAIYLLFPDLLANVTYSKVIAFAKDNQSLLGVGGLTLAYCLGSAILPISSQLVNDEHWPFPEYKIRCQAVIAEQQSLERIGYTALPTHLKLQDLQSGKCSAYSEGASLDDVNKTERILTIFDQQERMILSQTSENTERLKQLRGRIVVLRGAVFSGCVLFLICLFAYMARVNGQSWHWKRTLWGILLAAFFAVYVLRNAYKDFKAKNIFDIPVLEGVLGAVIIFGGFLMIRGVKNCLFQRERSLLVVALFAALAGVGWGASEIIYDQEVLSSLAVPQNQAETPKR